MSAAISTGYCSSPSPTVSCVSDLALNCVMRLSQPTGVTQVSIQASSACAGTEDCTMMVDAFGSMPAARNSAAISSIFGLQFGGVLVDRDGVQVDDAVDALVVVLDPHPVLQRTQIVADVQIAGRLDAGEDSCFHAKRG